MFDSSYSDSQAMKKMYADLDYEIMNRHIKNTKLLLSGVNSEKSLEFKQALAWALELMIEKKKGFEKNVLK